MNNNELRKKLIDEKSRIIFDARINYKKDKSLMSFYNLLKRNKEIYIFRELDEYIEKSKLSMIYIWGDNDFSLYSYQVLKDAGYSVGGLISNDSECKLRVFNFVTVDEIRQQLDGIIIILFDRDISYVPHEVLKNAHILNLYSHVVGRTGNQYFDFFSAGENEVFLDAGALDGETSKKFISWCNGNYSAVYAFEANPLMIKNCKKQLEQIVDQNKLFFYEYALWNQEDIVCFDNSGSKWDAHVCETGETFIKANSIDNLLKDKKVTFLKFDIEGSEIRAIQGACNCILRNRPRMAISVYHNDTDLEDIMNFFINLNLEYNFALRHYHSDSIETVLYVF